MEETKSVVTRDFDRSGHYEAGLQALVKSLRWAFGLLLVAIIGMLIYFISWGGYFTVEPQQAVIVMRFGKVIDCFTSGGHWYLPYPVNRFVRVQVNQQFLNINFIAPKQIFYCVLKVATIFFHIIFYYFFIFFREITSDCYFRYCFYFNHF